MIRARHADERAGTKPGIVPSWTVIYDGNCGLCGKAMTVLRSWDRRQQLEVVSFQAPGIQARFPWIPLEAFEEAVQLVGPTGQTWQGEGAVEQLLQILPKGRLLGWIFAVPFVRPLADRLYKWVARNRYRLGCGEHCPYHPPSSSVVKSDRPN